MLKAQQANLVQQASNDLVNIRNIEIQYYVNFFSNIGIQSAFIAGYQLSTISQVERTGNNSIFFSYAYWITSVISICCSLESLLVALYLTVFGQGLALRGPAGSMIKAINAFHYYQKHVLLSFTLNIFFLGISTICQFYVFMTLYGAHICAALMVVGMSIWWVFCLQVFNRFKYVTEPIAWRTSSSAGGSRFSEINPVDALEAGQAKKDDMQSETSDTTAGSVQQPYPDYQQQQMNSPVADDVSVVPGSSNVGNGTVAMQDVSWRRRIFAKFLSGKGPRDTQSQTSSVAGSTDVGTPNPMQQQQARRPPDSNFEKVLHEGMMMLRTAGREVAPTAWLKRYGLLVNSGLLMVFTSKADYERNPSGALCKVFKAINVMNYKYHSASVDEEQVVVLAPLNGGVSIEIRFPNHIETTQFLGQIGHMITGHSNAAKLL